jgi:hypothetical protein
MLKLIFTYNHQVIFFTIDNKNIKYFDQKWQSGINFIPKDQNLVRTLIMSRNRIAHEMINWINDANSGKNLEEWEACKDDYEVAEVIKREAKMKGCVFRNLFTEEDIAKQKIDNTSISKVIETEEQQSITQSQDTPENIVEGEPQ